MPAVIPLIAQAATAATAAFSISGILTSLATSIVLGGLQKLIAPKPKSGGSISGPSLSRGITTQIKQPILTRKPIYGEIRVSGGLLFIASSSGNDYLHFIIEIAPHEIEEIGEIWINDYSIAPDHLDGSGVVNTGRYANVVRIKKHLGATGQTADSDLDSEVTGWTSNHTLTGIAYLYIRMQYDSDVFPTGVPNVSAFVKGKKVLDTRDSVTRYSNNLALILNDNLLDNTFGLGSTSSEIDGTFCDAAANVCEEMVDTADLSMTVSSIATGTEIITLSGERLLFQTGDRVQMTTTGVLPTGISAATNYFVIAYQRKDTVRIKLASSYANALAGTAVNITAAGSGTHTITKNAEPRYAGAIQIDSDNEIGENIKDILTGMSGQLIYAGGSYRILAGAYQTPTVYFDEGDIVSAISVQTKISRRERFNAVQGVYISPINDGQPSDYPSVSNATYKAEDNNELIVRQIDFPATQRPHTAQRLAKIELEKSRQEITWTADFNLSAMLVQAGDTAFFTIARFGWTNKVFEVAAWKLEVRDNNGVPVPVVNMTLRETASGVWDWNDGEETAVDLAANTDLPDPYTVSPPTGLAVDPMEVGTAEGDLTYKFRISWTPPSDFFVTNGGYYEIQFKQSSDSDWSSSFDAKDDDTFIEVLQVKPGINYDTRIRAVNNLGVRSSWQSLFGFTVDSPSGATIQIDYGSITGSVVESYDFGTITGSNDATNDYGDIV